MKELTKEQARRFILAKQGLLGRYRFSGKEGALSYIRQAGCIQFDPVDVCGKNAELSLQSRVKGFRKSMLYDLLYKDRRLVDYADKELSIWPAEDWPYFAPYRERSRTLGASFEGLAELEEQALAYIRENGPVSSDTLPIEGEIFWHSSMHWSGNWHKKSLAARSVLEQLYTDGMLLIHHKSGSRKFYDLAERCLDPELLNADNPCPDADALLCWRMLRRIGAVGLLWNKSSTAFLGINPAAETRRRAFALLEEAGKILPIRVEGIKPTFYCLAEDETLMRSILAEEADRRPRMEFLAPLDPMLWDKQLIAALWGFSYRWEIYTPAEKRKYGYYTLPILWGERFVGRLEAAVDRKAGTLLVKNIWYEPGVRQTKTLQSALEKTVRRFAKFNECAVPDKDWLRRKLQSRNDLRLYLPKPEDGWFYVKMLSDPTTMAYNAPWFPPDGCIPNPEAEWEGLCRNWIGQEPERFYAYLQRKSDGAFVGDVNFHHNPDKDWWDMGIVIYAPERGKGYGKQGLQMLVDRAFRVAGISCLHNEFEATREAAYHVHKSVGFREVGEENGIIQLLLTKES